MPTLSEQLARFTTELSYQDLPAEVIDKTKTLLMHDLGVGLAGYSTETAQIAVEVAKKEKGGKSTIFIDGSRVTPSTAAFANGVIMQSRAQDDDYHRGIIHLGVVAIPAALALGEMVNSNGKDIITALAAGYEVGCRLSGDFCRLSIKRGFRSTSVYGPLAAAITAANVLNLSQEQTTFALGWAANLASGLLQCSVAKTPEMPFQSGLTSRNAVMASLLGQAGAKTAATILEGPSGFYRAFTGLEEGLEQIIDGLGSHYEMLDIFLKPYPVGGIIQTPVSAMLALAKEHNINPSDIAQVTIKMNPLEALYPGADSLKPGLLSVQYCLGLACVHRQITFDTITQLDNPMVLSLMSKTKVLPDESLERMCCRLDVAMNDGQTFSREAIVTAHDYCFDFDTDAKLIRSLIPEMGLPEDKIHRLIEAVKDLEACNNIGQLVRMLVFPEKREVARYRLPF